MGRSAASGVRMQGTGIRAAGRVAGGLALRPKGIMVAHAISKTALVGIWVWAGPAALAAPGTTCEVSAIISTMAAMLASAAWPSLDCQKP